MKKQITYTFYQDDEYSKNLMQLQWYITFIPKRDLHFFHADIQFINCLAVCKTDYNEEFLLESRNLVRKFEYYVKYGLINIKPKHRFKLGA